MIGKHLKDYKKKYLSKRDRFSVKKNTDWRRRWLPFIKYDHDFDGAFIIELLTHKLHIMLDYYEHGKYCMQVDESRLEIVESLRHACELGDAIVADEFNNESLEILMTKCKEYTTSNGDGTCTLHFDWDSPEDEQRYRLLKNIRSGPAHRLHRIAAFSVEKRGIFADDIGHMDL